MAYDLTHDHVYHICIYCICIEIRRIVDFKSVRMCGVVESLKSMKHYYTAA